MRIDSPSRPACDIIAAKRTTIYDHYCHLNKCVLLNPFEYRANCALFEGKTRLYYRIRVLCIICESLFEKEWRERRRRRFPAFFRGTGV